MTGIFAMDDAFNQELANCLAALRSGGVIVYPTDTVWGIGCDATNDDAVRKVFAIKQRPDSKALITLVESVAALERVVPEVPEVAYQLLEAAVDPLTVVYDRGVGVSPLLLADDGTVGVRVTSERFSSELCRRLRRPIVSTSVNISGCTPPHGFPEINPDILDKVDYVCRWGQDRPWASKPSTVIRLSRGGLFKILRK